jgi:hypothetical protein
MPIFGSEDWFAEGKTVVGEEEEEIAEAEYLGYTPHLYREYYPDGFSACIADQECRGNKNAREACSKLINGDPSEIITIAKYSGGALSSVLSGCSKVFSTTKLGSKMQATALSGSSISNLKEALTTPGYDYQKDPYKNTGGVGILPPTTPEPSGNCPRGRQYQAPIFGGCDPGYYREKKWGRDLCICEKGASAATWYTDLAGWASGNMKLVMILFVVLIVGLVIMKLASKKVSIG